MKAKGDEAVNAALADADTVKGQVRPGDVPGAIEQHEDAIDRLNGRRLGQATRIANAWRAAENAWPAQGKPAETIVACAKQASDDLAEVMVLVTEVTVATELSRALDAGKRPGETLTVGDVLDGSVPKPAISDVATWLFKNNAAAVRNGLVMSDGLVFRLPNGRSGRTWRTLAPAFWLGFWVAVLWAASEVGRSDEELKSFGSWFTAFGAALAGLLAHFAAGILREKRTGSPVEGVSVPANRWRWLLLRPNLVFRALLPLMITVVGLRLLEYPVDLDEPKTLLTYVFAGYSADSLAVAFSGRFAATQATAQKSILAKVA